MLKVAGTWHNEKLEGIKQAWISDGGRQTPDQSDRLPCGARSLILQRKGTEGNRPLGKKTRWQLQTKEKGTPV